MAAALFVRKGADTLLTKLKSHLDIALVLVVLFALGCLRCGLIGGILYIVVMACVLAIMLAVAWL